MGKNEAFPVLGLSFHTGWAVAVVTSGSLDDPQVVERRRLTLCDESLPRMVFHACEGLAVDEAEELVRQVRDSAQELTEREIGDLVAARRRADDPIRGAAIVGREPEPLPELPAILGSHRMIHTAEGALYKEVAADVCRQARLRPVYVPPKELPATVADALGVDEDAVAELVTRTGKSLGPPWQADHKQAFLAALLNAASRTGPGVRNRRNP
jgi:hypothetical protein